MSKVADRPSNLRPGDRVERVLCAERSRERGRPRPQIERSRDSDARVDSRKTAAQPFIQHVVAGGDARAPDSALRKSCGLRASRPVGRSRRDRRRGERPPVSRQPSTPKGEPVTSLSHGRDRPRPRLCFAQNTCANIRHFRRSCRSCRPGNS